MPIFMKNPARIRKDKDNCVNDLRLNDRAVENYTGRMHNERGDFQRIKVNGKERNFFRTHKMRKWYSNKLRFKAGFSSDDIKYLMGQEQVMYWNITSNPNNYNALKGNYRKALPFLSINDEIVSEENQEAIEQLKKENMVKDEEMAEMKKKQKSVGSRKWNYWKIC